MTNEEKAQAWYEEWDYFVKNPDDAIAFAAFCLDKREKQFTELRDLLEQLADIQNGPPLIQYENEWREIMDKTYTLLKVTE